MANMSDDPRWNYVWTPRHQFFYELLIDTQNGYVVWFSNRGKSLLVLPSTAYKYLCLYRGKKVEIEWDVSTGDATLDRIITDIKKELNSDRPFIKDLLVSEYSHKWEELHKNQSESYKPKGL